MLDAGRVDDAGKRVEPVAVERCGGLVQRLVVEDLRQLALVEVAADDRHRMDRGGRRDAEIPQRRDQPASRGVAERQVVDGRGKDVGDLLRDQLLGRGHPDIDRLRERANRRARLLAQCRVRLVADHELVRVVRERADVAREPRVRLDRERVAADRLLPFRDRGRDAVAVALCLQLAVELRDEQPAMREDEDSQRACRLDEPGGRDRLAGRGRVAEAVAALGSGILLRRECTVRLLVLRPLELELLVLFLLHLDEGAVAVSVGLGLLLVRGDELGQHPREGVDLMAAQLGTGSETRRLVRKDALEAEHQAVTHLPLRRRNSLAGIQLRDRVVERAAAGGSLGEHALRVLAGMKERLARPAFGAFDVFGYVSRNGRVDDEALDGFLHVGQRTGRYCLAHKGALVRRRATCQA